MFLVVGLGNPGEQYVRNRHNVGFQCLSYLAQRHGLAFNEKQHRARLATGVIRGQRVVLAKPFTYMNDSGLAVAALVRWYKLDPATHLLVIYDDLDLPFGTIRLRPGGSAGGQRGVQSIIQHLGTQQFPRLRVGIGRPPAGWDAKDYVLSNWTRAEEAALPELYARVADAVETVLGEGLAAAMNRFNVAPRDELRPPANEPSC
ncbi:aminoacyl-tRNA hydrolase [Kallotenue papyrolyticum]|uniref:aminoacyl-tRNA hydrolase n=1 Tax=Kallotenue papyrolyticum TaxID=1325125 RepID=UPI00047859A2|nr:aminoacyl-tRNA hydrolase [Kallotenue papyrolyticum]